MRVLGRLAWRPSPAGRSLGCRASRRRRPPRFPAPDRPCPADDHRSRAAPIAGALAGTALAGYLLPGLAAAWPPLRRPLGVEDRTRRRPRLRADLRRRPARAGHAGRARGARARAACARPSSSSASRSAATRRCRARSSPPATRSRCTATATATCCASRRAQVRADIARAEDAIEDATGRAPTLYRPPYGVLNAAALRSRARAAGARCCGATGGATGRRARRPSRSPRSSPAAPARARCCCCTTPTTTRRPAPGGARAAALPRVLETMRARGLEAVLP